MHAIACIESSLSETLSTYHGIDFSREAPLCWPHHAAISTRCLNSSVLSSLSDVPVPGYEKLFFVDVSRVSRTPGFLDVCISQTAHHCTMYPSCQKSPRRYRCMGYESRCSKPLCLWPLSTAARAGALFETLGIIRSGVKWR
jgi:hypothetical protein